MPSKEAVEAIALMRADKGVSELSLAERRIDWHNRAEEEPLPEGTKVTHETIAGISCERVSNCDGQSDDVFLLLHGGGYVNGDSVTHRKFAAYISAEVGREVIVPDYRLAPEHHFPAGLEDARAVYDALLAGGLASKQIAIGGDSAGGGLSLALVLNLRDDKADQPSCAVLLSPWTDILCRGDSYETNAEIDAFMMADGLRGSGVEYTGPNDPDHPLISPIKADLSGLPPLLVHVGGAEIMLDDSVVFVELAKAAGVEVHFEIWDDMWHVWQNHVPNVPESVEAMRRIGEFVKAH